LLANQSQFRTRPLEFRVAAEWQVATRGGNNTGTRAISSSGNSPDLLIAKIAG
jgi:hypothetical protein